METAHDGKPALETAGMTVQEGRVEEADKDATSEEAQTEGPSRRLQPNPL